MRLSISTQEKTMTDSQKRKVKDYRSIGYGYKKIAKIVGISENTVKAYCRRAGLAGNVKKPAEEGKRVCLACGKPLEIVPGRKPKKFCSDACRARWWNAHLELVKRKAVYSYTCPVCGKTFEVYGNSKRKYCSHECYIKDRFGGKKNA